MTPSRRTFLGLAVVGALAVVGCSPDATGEAAPEEQVPLTVGMTFIPNVQFSPFYVGVEEGIFAEHGLDVTLRHHGMQEDAFGALLSGEEDVVFASSDEAVVASTSAPDLRTFATSYQEFPVVILAPADSGIDSVPDLEGLSVGLPGHFGSNYYGILAALDDAGLSEDDIDLVDIGYTQVSALTTGEVDAVVGYSNNEAVQFATAGFDVVALPVQDEGEPSLVGPGLVTVAGRHEEDVLRRLADAMAEAERRVVADPEAALEATEREVPTLADPEQRAAAEAVLEATTRLWLVDGEVSVAVDPDAFQRMGQFLADAGIIDSPPADETVIQP